MRTLLPRGAGNGRTRTALVLAALVVVSSVAMSGVAVGTSTSASSAAAGSSSSPPATVAIQQNVSETEFVVPVPEEGDPYFEARADDGSWVSYVNPRDEYRSPYLGDGSGKICVSLFNEAGQVVSGESVPNTTVTVPTGESLDWHSYANPVTVEYPLTEHYERPLDGDQFGTDAEVIQGDGYLDAHCIGIHGLPEDGGEVQYGEAEITGEHADDIDLVGYVQQEHEAWDTDVDPIEDAQSYEEAGGGWTFYPDRSHGQVVVVLQLDGEGNSSLNDSAANETANSSDGNSSNGDENATNSSDGDNESSSSMPSDSSDTDESDDSGEPSSTSDGLPGFGAIAAIVALGSVTLARYVGSRTS